MYNIKQLSEKSKGLLHNSRTSFLASEGGEKECQRLELMVI